MVQVFANSVTAQPFTSYVQGTVRDANGNPLEKASIRFLLSNFAVLSDQQGKFKAGPLKEGTYELQITLVGYKSVYHTVSVKAGEDKEESITMVLANEQLQTVEITGRKEKCYANL